MSGTPTAEKPAVEDESNEKGHSFAAMIFLIVMASVCGAVLIGWRVWHVRRWEVRARSAKVLDEIEMEFVNDDEDIFTDSENVLHVER